MSKSRSKMKIGLKQILSGILTLMLVFTSVPFAGFTTYAAGPREYEVKGTKLEDLWDAMDEVNDGDSIVINGTVKVYHFFKIYKNITLKGSGTITRTPDYTGEIILIEGLDGKDVNVTMKDITIDGGGTGTSQAVHISSNASLTMESGTIKNNKTSNEYCEGGGVQVGAKYKRYDKAGTFIMKGGTISGNTAGKGGGVYNKGTFKMEKGIKDDGTITEGTITGNTAKEGSGVYNESFFEMNAGIISGNNATENGGGVFNHGNFYMNIGTIRDNNANANGGGVHNYNSSFFYMNAGTINGNSAADGGGVCVEYASDLKVHGDATIINNGTDKNNNVRFGSADSYITVTGEFTGLIGLKHKDFDKVAVKAEDDYTLTLNDVDHFLTDDIGNHLEFVDNTLVYKASGSSRYVQDKIDNAANGDTITIDDNIFIDKTVEVNKNITLKGNGTLTRAQYFKDKILNIGSNANVTIEGITIDGNNVADTTGSAVYINSGSFLTMNSGTIKNNRAENGGGVYVDRGGNLRVQGEVTIINNGKDKNNNNNVRFGSADSYITVVGKPSGLIGLKQDSDKAAVRAAEGYTLTQDDAEHFFADDIDSHLELINNTFVYKVGTGSWNLQSRINNASDGDTIVIDNTINIDRTVEVNKSITLKGSGTLIRAEGFKDKMLNISSNANVTIEGIAIDGNNVKDSTGSAVYVNEGSSLTTNNVTIKNNTSDKGSGVYNAGTFKMTSGTISKNTADNGGGVYNDGTFEITGGTIRENTADNGGGVYNNAGTLKMTGGTIRNNNANYGGGVHNNSTFTMTGGTISKNTAEKLGGGLYLNKGTFEVQGAAVINDNAKNDNVRVESSDYPIILSGGYNGVIRVNSNFGNVVVKAADGYAMTQDDVDCFTADGSDDHLEYMDGKLIYTKNKTEWGQMVQSNGVTYYVDENGRVSAEVVGNGKIWLNTKSDGSGSWYCIDNSQGTFKIGSRFYIQVIDDISKYYDKIGSEYRDKIEDGKLKIFLIGVTDPDGKEYTNLDTEINCYVKVNPNWDKDKINAIFINGEKSEKVDIEYMGTLDGPSNGDKFIRLTLKHFSPYAIYQAKSQDNVQNDLITEDNALDNTFATGENANYGYILGLSTMAIAALAGLIFTKKKFNR